MDYFTKRDWIEIFESCGIRLGYRVLLQIDCDHLRETAGGVQTILEALMEVVTSSGTIIIPAFSLSALDPACREKIPCSYEKWVEYRRSLYGFEKELTESSLPAMILQRIQGTLRTDHPVRSFVVWGSCNQEWVKQPLDFPVSFGHVFSVFEERMSCNVLIGVPWEESLLVLAMAHLTELELVGIQKAWHHRPKRNLAKTFLVGIPDPAAYDEIRELLHTEEVQTVAGMVEVLSLYSSPNKTKEIWLNSRNSEHKGSCL